MRRKKIEIQKINYRRRLNGTCYFSDTRIFSIVNVIMTDANGRDRYDYGVSPHRLASRYQRVFREHVERVQADTVFALRCGET